MSHNPEQYGYFDSEKESRIAKKVQKAMKQQECYCPYCYWMGQWDDVNVNITPQTMQDPEERQYFCPLCGREVEGAGE